MISDVKNHPGDIFLSCSHSSTEFQSSRFEKELPVDTKFGTEFDAKFGIQFDKKKILDASLERCSHDRSSDRQSLPSEQKNIDDSKIVRKFDDSKIVGKFDNSSKFVVGKLYREPSRFCGVSSDPSGRWEAYVYALRKKIYLGNWDDDESAARAHDRATICIFGRNAPNINFGLSHYEDELDELEILTHSEIISRLRLEAKEAKRNYNHRCGREEHKHCPSSCGSKNKTEHTAVRSTIEEPSLFSVPFTFQEPSQLSVHSDIQEKSQRSASQDQVQIRDSPKEFPEVRTRNSGTPGSLCRVSHLPYLQRKPCLESPYRVLSAPPLSSALGKDKSFLESPYRVLSAPPLSSSLGKEKSFLESPYRVLSAPPLSENSEKYARMDNCEDMETSESSQAIGTHPHKRKRIHHFVPCISKSTGIDKSITTFQTVGVGQQFKAYKDLTTDLHQGKKSKTSSVSHSDVVDDLRCVDKRTKNEDPTDKCLRKSFFQVDGSESAESAHNISSTQTEEDHSTEVSSQCLKKALHLRELSTLSHSTNNLPLQHSAAPERRREREVLHPCVPVVPQFGAWNPPQYTNYHENTFVPQSMFNRATSCTPVNLHQSHKPSDFFGASFVQPVTSGKLTRGNCISMLPSYGVHQIQNQHQLPHHAIHEGRMHPPNMTLFRPKPRRLSTSSPPKISLPKLEQPISSSCSCSCSSACSVRPFAAKEEERKGKREDLSDSTGAVFNVKEEEGKRKGADLSDSNGAFSEVSNALAAEVQARLEAEARMRLYV